MKVNSIKYNNPSFGIKISPDVLEAADKFYVQNNHSQEQFNKFYRKVKYMEENYGFNEYTLSIKSFRQNGKRVKGIFATKEMNPEKPILISVKDNFKKILEKFTHINEYELNNKLL